MAERRRLVLLQKEVTRPRESVSDGKEQQGVPAVSRKECAQHDGNTQRRTDRVQNSVARVTVLLQVKLEELFVGFQLIGLGHSATLLAASESVLRRAELRAIRYYQLQPTPRRMASTMRVGLLTGGGDCPGLNAVIRAVVRKGILHYDDEFVGFMEGWRGVLENKTMVLDYDSIAGILPRGGTILRTSRTNPAKRDGGLARCMETLKHNNLDALIAIGGDDTN